MLFAFTSCLILYVIIRRSAVRKGIWSFVLVCLTLLTCLESLLVIRQLGVQLTTTYFGGTKVIHSIRFAFVLTLRSLSLLTSRKSKRWSLTRGSLAGELYFTWHLSWKRKRKWLSLLRYDYFSWRMFLSYQGSKTEARCSSCSLPWHKYVILPVPYFSCESFFRIHYLWRSNLTCAEYELSSFHNFVDDQYAYFRKEMIRIHLL
jgi:hypothetical protein